MPKNIWHQTLLGPWDSDRVDKLITSGTLLVYSITRTFGTLGFLGRLDINTKALLKKVGWKAKVLRGQGVGTWMVSAIAGPPVRSIEVNEATIVILEDQVQTQRAILASTSRNVVNKTTLQVAPYEVNAIKSTPLLPEVKSKFEQLEAKANARVDHLEQQVSALAVQVQEQAGKTNTAIQSLEGKVEHIAKMEDRFELVLKKFGQQQEQRVQRLEEQQQATLNEIKMAIEQSPKVRKVEAQAHPWDWG